MDRPSSTALAERIAQLEREMETLTEENARLRDLVQRDELTGIGNRRLFREQLDRALAYAGRYGSTVSVLVADLDGLKGLNDSCGHPAGDVALRRVGEILGSSLRTADLAARLGGDEFAAVMPHTSATEAAIVAERIRVRIESLLLEGGYRLTASFGVATYIHDGTHTMAPQELFARADSALYAAKRSGKNRVCVNAKKSTRAA